MNHMIPPFRRFVIENFPFIEKDFDALTNYQLFCKVVEYLNKVIGSQNEVTQQMQYVLDYFNNLDVQEEIDKKLDEMAESGELADIIAGYIELRGILAYDTVASMKTADNLVDGSFAETYGYHAKGDGGSAKYKIREITNADTVDEASIIALADDQLVAELIIGDEVNTKQFGAYGDKTHDDTASLQKAINYACNHNGIVHFDNGLYKITDTLTIPSMKTIKLYGDFDMGKTNDNLVYGAEIFQATNNKIIFNFLGSNYRSRVSGLRFNTELTSTGVIGIKSNTLLGEFTLEKLSFEHGFAKCIEFERAGIGTISNCIFSHSDMGIDCQYCSSIQFLYNNFANNTVSVKVGIIDGCKFDANWFEAAGDGNANDIAILFQAPSVVHWCDFIDNNFNMLNSAILFDGITNITEYMSFNMLQFINDRITAATPVKIDMKNAGGTTNQNASNMYRLIWKDCVFNNVTSGQVFDIDYDALGLNDGMRVIDCFGYTTYTGGSANMFTSDQNNTAVVNTTNNGLSTNGCITLDSITSTSKIKKNSFWSDSNHIIYVRNNDNADKKLMVLDRGASTARPTTNRLTGDMFYDQTLGKPIWWNGSVWIDAAGNAV